MLAECLSAVMYAVEYILGLMSGLYSYFEMKGLLMGMVGVCLAYRFLLTPIMGGSFITGSDAASPRYSRDRLECSGNPRIGQK